MIEDLVFASGNAGKLTEIRKFFENDKIKIFGTKDYGIENFEVDEDRDSLRGNAEKKALELFDIIKKPVFADDTGLFVEYLDGRPGVYSARYAGEHADFKANRVKMLNELKGVKFENRKAKFISVIAYVSENRKVYFFEGSVDGYISEEERGDKGFGYDSIFYLPSKKMNYAQMDLEEKNRISHRTLALKKFREYILNK